MLEEKGGSEEERRKTIWACFAHVDDEIWALGTMANHVSRGDRVVLTWMTYGEMTSLFGDIPTEEIVEKRNEHAKEVGRIIGCEVSFLDFGDTQVEATRENAVRIARQIGELRPDAILAWNTYRGHPDHRATTQLLIDATTYARFPKLMSPLSPHRERVTFYLYHDEHCPYSRAYVDVSDQVGKVVEVVDYYSKTYKWVGSGEEAKERLRRNGRECGTEYAEKFNVIRRHQPAIEYLV